MMLNNLMSVIATRLAETLNTTIAGPAPAPRRGRQKATSPSPPEGEGAGEGK
jgi:hypothetical protein